MNNYSCFLTVRTGSTRLRNKCFLPFGDSNVLGHVIERAKHAGLHPIVTTTTHKSDDAIESFCKSIGTEYFRGSLEDKLERWFEAANKFEIKDFHTVDVDDPYFDPRQVVESLNLLRSKNLDVVLPTVKSSVGAASVGYSFSTAFVSRVIQLGTSRVISEMIDVELANIEQISQATLVSKYEEIDNVRLTLDYVEDYWLLKTLNRILGRDASRDQIIKLFNDNPNLREVNWFRNMEWSTRQDEIRLNSRDAKE